MLAVTQIAYIYFWFFICKNWFNIKITMLKIGQASYTYIF